MDERLFPSLGGESLVRSKNGGERHPTSGLGTLIGVRRIARVVGIIGGIGAVVWAMRDRFISVALPREPTPPAFKVPTEMATAPTSTTADPPGSITDVPGIGPVYATRLEAIGIATLGDLAGADAEDASHAAQVPVTRAQGWIQAAQALVGGP